MEDNAYLNIKVFGILAVFTIGLVGCSKEPSQVEEDKPQLSERIAPVLSTEEIAKANEADAKADLIPAVNSKVVGFAHLIENDQNLKLNLIASGLPNDSIHYVRIKPTPQELQMPAADKQNAPNAKEEPPSEQPTNVAAQGNAQQQQTEKVEQLNDALPEENQTTTNFVEIGKIRGDENGNAELNVDLPNLKLDGDLSILGQTLFIAQSAGPESGENEKAIAFGVIQKIN